jgi:hypothetical protein
MDRRMLEYLIAQVKKDIKDREKRIAYKSEIGDMVEYRIWALNEKKHYLEILEEMLRQA